MGDGAPRGDGGVVTIMSLRGETWSTAVVADDRMVPYGIFQFMNLAQVSDFEAAAAVFMSPYILLPLRVIRPERLLVSKTASPAPGCSVIAFLFSVLRYLLRFVLSYSCPRRVIADDLPSCALVWMTWYKAAFFEVDVFFFHFHCLIRYLY